MSKQIEAMKLPPLPSGYISPGMSPVYSASMMMTYAEQAVREALAEQPAPASASSLGSLKLSMEHSAWEGVIQLSDALKNINEWAAEQPAQQEIDWKDQYEKQKRRADMWVAKYEADIGPLEKAGPVAEQPAPVQQGILARKWVLHGGFADVASFDAEGFPSFYWKESVAKFKAGELSTPCKGKNCGSLNGWLHSAECRAEHEAHYAVTKGNT